MNGGAIAPENRASLRRTLLMRSEGRVLAIRCECGFEARGTLSQLLPVMRKHGREAHNMKVTRAGVAALARPVTGPVQAEVFVLRMLDGAPQLAGPCGPDPWYLEVREGEDPVEVVARLSRNLMGAPLLVHSTSWRRDRGGVILSFVVVNAPGQAAELTGIPVRRADLARSSATGAAASIKAEQVLEHGLRHLAWLAVEDETVRTTLDDSWKIALKDYVPEPFRHLG